jgi:hypothetical protein
MTPHSPQAQSAASVPPSVLQSRYLCPECRAVFAPKHWRSLFCCAEHRVAWHNRATVRGRVLTPLVMAARQTRGGSRGDRDTGKAARRDADAHMQRWRDEDRAAGRMDQAEYIRRRNKLGFDQ